MSLGKSKTALGQHMRNLPSRPGRRGELSSSAGLWCSLVVATLNLRKYIGCGATWNLRKFRVYFVFTFKQAESPRRGRPC